MSEHPFYLIINVGDESTTIDLDESQWKTTYGDILRAEGEWHLVRKADAAVVLSLRVSDGEQPYFTVRHFSRAKGKGAGTDIPSYGIGKKRLDGHTDRLWVMPNGMVCGGDDNEFFAFDELDQMAYGEVETE